MHRRVPVSALLLMMLTWSASSAAAATITTVPSPQTVNVGDLFTVSVDVTNVTDLWAYNFDVNYDSTLVQLVKSGSDPTVEGPFLGSNNPPLGTFYIAGDDSVLGSITSIANTLQGSDPGVSGSGSLSLITFLALAQGTALFSLDNITLFDFDLNEIAFTAVNGSANIVTPVPEPATMLLLGTGLALAAHQRMRRS